jgi:short-subunit dehydrogenase
MTSRIDGTKVWVVGASSGIGAALAEELVRRGATVAVSARRGERLESIAEGRMVVAPMDVTDREDVDATAAAVWGDLGGIDAVVLNAGVWEQFRAASWDRDSFQHHVEVNLLGFSNVLGAVLPRMVERGSGHVVGVASVAGYRGIAGAEAYGATKAAQINLLEALRSAVASRGIAVTTVCPGFVRTELTESNSFPMPFIVEADRAARSICDGWERGQVEIVFPLPMAILMKTARLLPVRLWASVSRRLAGG